ncbi:MAG: SAM-dependent methyltransferase [Chloroflexi bacterium]|nr:SAM-dependent methyltransferase [Chloroflexota bacterium]
MMRQPQDFSAPFLGQRKEGNLVKVIQRRIRKTGPLTFAQFMELCLYHPSLGYYTAGRQRVGPQGDYYTSPSAHPIFGALLAHQLEQLWAILDHPRPFVVVELGAGKGLLAADILTSVQQLSSGFQDALRYVLADRSPRPPARPADQHIWAICSNAIPLAEVTGCFLSNELLDSFPTHIVEQREGKLLEVYVDLEGNRFVEALGDPSTSLLEQRLAQAGVTLADGQRAEVCLALRDWVASVSQSLARGFVLTIDYGYEARELYAPHRRRGTLLCYYHHSVSEDPYIRVGEQDISVHVDFSTVILEGQRHGLHPEGLTTQRAFLQNLGIEAYIDALARQGLPQSAYYANMQGMRDLIKPDGLGTFKILIQSKGVEGGHLDGLTPNNKRLRQLHAHPEALVVPLLTPEHTPLLAGAYPHLAWEGDVTWPWEEKPEEPRE